MSGRLGSYTIQAAIVSVHAVAESVSATNWSLIVSYYDMLLSMQTSPVVELQRAIAVGMRDGPEVGLVIIDELIESGKLANYHQLHAARADLARRSGSLDEAAISYRRAIELARQGPERRYLQRQLEGICG